MEEEEETMMEMEMMTMIIPFQSLIPIHRPVLLMMKNFTSPVVVFDTWMRQRIRFLQFLLNRNK